MISTSQQLLGRTKKKYKVDRSCGTYGRLKRYIRGFGWETCGKETALKTGVGGRIILKWIVQKWDEELWTGLIWLRIGKGESVCKCGFEPSVSIKRGLFRD
jgi:hypothetical protein